MDVITLTQRLLAFDTVNPPGNESSCAAFLYDLLAAAGFEAQLHPMPDGRTNLVAYMGNGTGKPLAFTGHLDTVPLGHQPWQVNPFAGDIIDGRLYGRGSTDMKAGVAAFVSAAIAGAGRLKQGPGVLLLITCGEETGCDGARHLVQSIALPPVAGLIVAEPTLNRPAHGHKGVLWLKATSRGVTAHGSMPERGDNAIAKAARFITRLENFTFDTPTHPVMGRPTINVGTIKGGLNVNSVPDLAEIEIDLRSVPPMQHAELTTQIAQLANDDAEISTLLDLPPVWTDPNVPIVKRIGDICAARTAAPMRQASVSYFTDAALLQPALQNAPTVILGPGDPALAHQTDEYCIVDNITQAVEIYGAILTDFAEM
ncbi:M20 family metallopeptidase [Pacificibacter marinus]|uniref:M20 family metallopeptidase n=1 Tax=Pacificibacter marinus TaxID=658057 RepID=UPI001C072184|nr:M20 family metallopeptidase [Pacificibacter marinus]MBU2867976.1 M20 family metallopeptidase [Pacificibacter marinus]